MLVKIKSSGAEVHLDKAVGFALVQTGLAEEVKGAPKPSRLPQPGQFTPPEPQWSVGLHSTTRGQKFLAIEMRVGARVELFFGHPDLVNASQEREGGGYRHLNGFGRTVPNEIVQKYAAAWRADFDVRGSEVARRESYTNA